MKRTNKEQYKIRFSMRAENDEAEVMIYSDITSEKWFEDEVTPGDFDKALKEARKNGATRLNVRINSPGGDVYSAVAMRSMIINAGFESVRIMIEGLCASAATLFVTVPGARTVIAEGSEFMIHNPMTIAWGNAQEMEKTVEHLHKLEEQFHGMYAQKTGRSEDEIKDLMDAETWFTAKEACEYGFCDEMLEAEPVAAMVRARDLPVMRAIYKKVPDNITALQDDSNDPPDTGVSPVNKIEEENESMDIKELTVDQLRAENPVLLDKIMQDAVNAERERLNDIDALTIPGYEAMADEAKQNGMSAMDYQKKIVAAMKEKGAKYIEARQKETAPAQNVKGDAPKSSVNDDEEIKANATDLAKYAENYRGDTDGNMF